MKPAASGVRARLCVETLFNWMLEARIEAAAFGRLCVETWYSKGDFGAGGRQPPSGGCVLKHGGNGRGARAYAAAAFGRLCVETTV